MNICRNYDSKLDQKAARSCYLVARDQEFQVIFSPYLTLSPLSPSFLPFRFSFSLSLPQYLLPSLLPCSYTSPLTALLHDGIPSCVPRQALPSNRQTTVSRLGQALPTMYLPCPPFPLLLFYPPLFFFLLFFCFF